MTTMLTLMKKDWRVFRSAVIATVTLGAIPYLVIFAASFVPDHYHTAWQKQFLDALSGAAVCSIMIIGVLAGAFASSAFAAERNDRSADFLLLLPPRRWEILLSKLAVTLPWIILWFVVHAICICAVHAMQDHPNDYHDAFEATEDFMCGVAMLFGMAWMLSTFLKNPVLSFFIPIAAVGALGAFVGITVNLLEWNDATGTTFWGTLSLPIGIACFIGGCIHYLRRVQP